MLFLTGTTFNIPSLMGSIMSIGVVTANSILLVTFANFQLKEGKTSFQAIHAAAMTRLRPILMTALAMIVGMIPMALALGEGGEQNAPLGKAVIGGLIVATFTTLILCAYHVFLLADERKIPTCMPNMCLMFPLNIKRSIRKGID